jgi:pyruvate formate lyase activating enzyme
MSLWGAVHQFLQAVMDLPPKENRPIIQTGDLHPDHYKACAHRCHIAAGKRGVCRVRENNDGTLISLVYGMLIAAHVDPIEKKPLYHFYPGSRSFSIATAGSNFQCYLCQNWQISQAARGGEIAGDFTPPPDVVAAARAQKCDSISYTYTEPTIYFEYAYDCARLAKAAGLRNVFVTNGYQTPETIEIMAGLIDAANVDLKAFSDAFYRERCKARLQPVCDAIRLMHQAGIHVEVTTLIIPGKNDSMEQAEGIEGAQQAG